MSKLFSPIDSQLTTAFALIVIISLSNGVRKNSLEISVLLLRNAYANDDENVINN